MTAQTPKLIDAAQRGNLVPQFSGHGISVVGARKSFGITKALDGCTFKASLGEIHAIFGGNGSGKSTLAKVISGVLPVDSGQVSILGKTPSVPHEARALGIATVFQEVLIADECSIVDNLFLGGDSLWARSMSASEKSKTAISLMEELTGQHFDPELLAGALPLGLKQWITIGRALLRKPKVLILDESSAALDLDSTERLFSKMRELRDQGSAVIMVTHRIAEMIRVCDKVTVLRDGRDVGRLEKSEITEKNLIELMTGHEQAARVVLDAAAIGPVSLRADGLSIWKNSRAISFRLNQGEILGVVGLDGQGQSEFVRVLAGIDQPFKSLPQVVNSEGQFVEIRSLSEAAKNGIVYVSGDRKREGIFGNLSIFENLTIPLYSRRSIGGRAGIIDWRALFSIFQWEKERLAIRMGERTNKITSLSGGNQQKVLIGRAFSLSPNIMLLNDPARGIDIGAKTELYVHLKEFTSNGKSAIYLSSEIEELIGFCTRVLVFRNGSVFDEFTGTDINRSTILAAMFGQPRAHQRTAEALPIMNVVSKSVGQREESDTKDKENAGVFSLTSSAFTEGGKIPSKFTEKSNISPSLSWVNPPSGTRSYALAVTDPDLPEHLNFPRAFAHWMVFNIPSEITGLSEGVSPTGEMPRGARELKSDFVTFKIPGYETGYGGPWPPDAAHRYVFTLYALKVDSLDISDDADYIQFINAVLPKTISSASLIGIYGPAVTPLPGT